MLKIEQTFSYELNSILFYMRNFVKTKTRDEIADFIQSQILSDIDTGICDYLLI